MHCSSTSQLHTNMRVQVAPSKTRRHPQARPKRISPQTNLSSLPCTPQPCMCHSGCFAPHTHSPTQQGIRHAPGAGSQTPQRTCLTARAEKKNNSCKASHCIRLWFISMAGDAVPAGVFCLQAFHAPVWCRRPTLTPAIALSSNNTAKSYTLVRDCVSVSTLSLVRSQGSLNRTQQPPASV